MSQKRVARDPTGTSPAPKCPKLVSTMNENENQPDEWPEPEVIDAEIVVDSDADSLPTEIEATPAPDVPAAQPAVYKGSGFRWSFVFGALLVVLMIIVMFQNFQTVNFDFLQWSIDAPLAVIIFGAALIAVIVDELVGFFWRIQRRRQLRTKAELKQLKREISPPKQSRFRRAR